MLSDSDFMQIALELASRGIGRTTPNPPVGAVLVQNGQIVGEGFHRAAGQPHAEILAIREAGELARNAELFVTLEPCCHHGRTGPCTDAIISAGIHRVFVGCLDPNPQVSGQGIERLREAGIEVVCGILENKCQQLIAPFAKHIRSGLPFVIYKAALSLDGQTATSTGESQWISSPESRIHVHRLRNQVDAIIVGSGTVLADNPRLTTRLPEGGRNPLRIVIDHRLVTPLKAHVYDSQVAPGSLLITSNLHSRLKLDYFRKCGINVLQVDEVNGFLDLRAAMKKLGKMGKQLILLEGGSTLAGAMLHAGLIDRMMLFMAPIIFGGNDGRAIFTGQGVKHLSETYRLTDVRISRHAEDLLVEGEVAQCSLD